MKNGMNIFRQILEINEWEGFWVLMITTPKKF